MSETPDQIIAAALALPDDKKRELAWKLLDSVGISVVVALDADDFIEEHPDLSKAEIIEVLGEVSQLDWSDSATAAHDAVEVLLDQKSGVSDG